ncbi:MAG: hypothetical protein KGY38_08290, partial [Desulfobacterales bacterium]|nr:hypothetical protein [Desulfobacterales bacterium]
DSAIEALLPEQLRTLLDVPEHIRISEDGANNAEDRDDHYTVTYGAPVLERMIGKTLETIPVAGCRLEFDYIKNGGFDRLLEDQLTFYGAAAAIETVAPVTAEYVLVSCRYTALSDEQKEGLLTVVFNTDTGGRVPAMAEPFDTGRFRTVFIRPDTDVKHKILPLAEAIEHSARGLLEDRLAPFHASMNRRFQRDIANLEEYYSSLAAEMEKSLEKPGLSESARIDRQAKIDAIPAELAGKKEDLLKKYSIKVRLEPAAAMYIRTPAKKILCRLSIGKQRRQFFLTYNPVTRSIDPPPCTICKKPISHIHFNSRLEPVCHGCRK